MNDKELREIRRRFRPAKSNILSIRGCLVNSEKAIVAQFNQPLASCSQEESEKLLAIMKKSLSGGVGTNLLDLEFKGLDTANSDEHKRLCALRQSGLKDEAVLSEFYQRVIDSVSLEGSYAILLAFDNYDVFTYSQNGEKEDSSTVFSYIVCAVCPVKPLNAGLCFRQFDNSFRSLNEQAMLAPPEMGFMFPTFDDRAANIYNVLYYTKDVSNVHSDFINGIFNLEIPLSATEKKASFGSCLTDTLEDDCNLELVKSVHGQIAEMVEEHKQAKAEEPFVLSKTHLKSVLEYCGVSDEKIEQFGEKFDDSFGEKARLAPKSIVDTGKLELNTPDVSIKVNPERSDLVSTQVINGVRYIMIRASEGVEVNGVGIEIK